jgi:hypothetical protein
MRRWGKLRQNLAPCAGAAAATLIANSLLIAMPGAVPKAQGLVHHVEFLGTLMVLARLGETASVIAIVLAAPAVARIAATWPPPAR